MKNLLSLLDKFYDIIACSVGNEELFVLHWHRFKDLLQEEPLNYQKIYSYIAKINSENLNSSKPPIASIQRENHNSTRADVGDNSIPSLSRKNSVGVDNFKQPSFSGKENPGLFPARGLRDTKSFPNENPHITAGDSIFLQKSLTNSSI